MSNKTVIVGLEGANFDLIRPWGVLEPGSEPTDCRVQFREGTGPRILISDRQPDEGEEAVRDRVRALGHWA